MFSDGYVSQTGGSDIKKFKSSYFQELLLQIIDKSMSDQKLIIENRFDEWKGNHQQVDDILVIGVRVN